MRQAQLLLQCVLPKRSKHAVRAQGQPPMRRLAHYSPCNTVSLLALRAQPHSPPLLGINGRVIHLLIAHLQHQVLGRCAGSAEEGWVVGASECQPAACTLPAPPKQPAPKAARCKLAATAWGMSHRSG